MNRFPIQTLAALLVVSFASFGVSGTDVQLASLTWETNAIVNAYGAASGEMPAELNVEQYYPDVSAALDHISNASNPLNVILTCMGPCCASAYVPGCPQRSVNSTFNLGNVGVSVQKAWFVPNYVVEWAYDNKYLTDDDHRRWRLPLSILKDSSFISDLLAQEQNDTLGILSVDISGYKDPHGHTEMETQINSCGYLIQPQFLSNIQDLKDHVVRLLRKKRPFVLEYVIPATFTLNNGQNAYNFSLVYDDNSTADSCSMYFDWTDLQKVVSQEWMNKNPDPSSKVRRFKLPSGVVNSAINTLFTEKSPILKIPTREYQTFVNDTVQGLLCESSSAYSFCEGYRPPKNPDPLWPGTLRIATYACVPFTMCDSCSANTSFSGFSIEVWDKVANHLQIPIEYQCYGNQQDALDAVATGVADVGVGCTFITFDRQKRFRYTLPFFNGGLRILTAAPSLDVDGFALLYPFSAATWMRIFIFAFIVYPIARAVLIAVRERVDIEHDSAEYQPITFTKKVQIFLFFDFIIGVVGDMFGANGEFAATTEVDTGEGTRKLLFNTCIDDTHRGPDGRVVWKAVLIVFLQRTLRVLALVFGVVILALYTANLVSFLAVRQENSSINGPEDLVGRIIGAKNSTVAKEWADAHSKAFRVVGTVSTQEAVGMVLNGEMDAYIDDAAIVNFISQLNCSVRSVGPSFNHRDYGMFMRYGLEEVATDVNLYIQKLLDDGTVSNDAMAFRVHDVGSTCSIMENEVWHEPLGEEQCSFDKDAHGSLENRQYAGIDPEILSMMTRDTELSPTKSITTEELLTLFLTGSACQIGLVVLFYGLKRRGMKHPE